MDKKQLEELQKLPFEKALEQLESIVSKMENGQLPLDEMMKAYESGQALSSVCGEKLKSIEKKVEILRKKANGVTEWADFDTNMEQTSAAPVPEMKPVAIEDHDADEESGEEDLLF